MLSTWKMLIVEFVTWNMNIIFQPLIDTVTTKTGTKILANKILCSILFFIICYMFLFLFCADDVQFKVSSMIHKNFHSNIQSIDVWIGKRRIWTKNTTYTYLCKSSFVQTCFSSVTIVDEFIIILLKNTCYQSHGDYWNFYDAGNKMVKNCTPV